MKISPDEYDIIAAHILKDGAIVAMLKQHIFEGVSIYQLAKDNNLKTESTLRRAHSKVKAEVEYLDRIGAARGWWDSI